ncbi:universal stress protein [Robertkochia flava]|uniref:universal stress protein n=1 Tax=Robertkochia flava TaxID=3447986 RepID=UPI001CC8F503|nr:universal stress protein [Robertkochia marina]
MKRIVIPTDFSDNALHAIRYCHNLFLGEEVEFVLLHTFGADVYTSAATLGLRADTSAMERQLEDSRRKLDSLKALLQSEYNGFGCSYTLLTRYDFLPDAINSLLQEQPAFLVAMGTQGATGAKEIFLGSNAVRIMQRVTETAVLAIPEASPLVVPRKIALATAHTDLPKPDQLAAFRDLAGRYEAQITIIHISDEVRLNEKQKKNRDWLQEQLAACDPAVFTLDNDHVDQAIMEYVGNTNTDIIGIISRKHTFFESLLKRSTLKELGYHSKIPLLVMHHQ